MIDQPVITQRDFAARPWADELSARLPGLRPVPEGEWLIRDDAFGRQMALRDRLFAQHRERVFAETPDSHAAQRELFALIVREVRASGDYGEEGDYLVRPDQIAIDAAQPPALLAAARLVQEDLAILAPRPCAHGNAHVLIAAAIAFPASWMLAEKFNRTLAAIHEPVGRISGDMDRRIEALFERMPADRPMQRANALAYNDPSLFQPRPEGAPRTYDPAGKTWIRVERQTVRRLPASNAIAFTIHTSLVPFDRVGTEDAAGLRKYLHSIGAGAPKPTPG